MANYNIGMHPPSAASLARAAVILQRSLLFCRHVISLEPLVWAVLISATLASMPGRLSTPACQRSDNSSPPQKFSPRTSTDSYTHVSDSPYTCLILQLPGSFQQFSEDIRETYKKRPPFTSPRSPAPGMQVSVRHS